MAAAPKSFTAEMVRHLNDLHDWGWPRYEVVDGELLVTPAPRKLHQLVVNELHLALGNYLKREPIGRAFASPADLSWGHRKLVQPDVFVVPLDEVRKPEWTAVRHLLLAVEVLSPSNARGDRIVKRKLYQHEGVPAYWMVDADAKVVEIWTPEAKAARVERGTLLWHPAGASTPFTLALAELFQPI
ncbi:MAG TPA: Uma2 family endonuclease [Gemmatimonadaceae bacterium]|nr:Uma2 family endonuclease [Gemmatimonadaceae bacterium]